MVGLLTGAVAVRISVGITTIYTQATRGDRQEVLVHVITIRERDFHS